MIFEITIDLEINKSIKHVEARFLQSQVFWIFFPRKIEILHSSDGINYRYVI